MESGERLHRRRPQTRGASLNSAGSLYLIRHCKAAGQEPEAPLTQEGVEQARSLADLLSGAGIQRIVSSPFARAQHSIYPLAQQLGIEVETDARLAERVLSDQPLSDWRNCLRETFADLDLRFEGGESSRAAMERGTAALNDILRGGILPAAVVSHGNLTALLLRHFDNRFGFDDWQNLSNPDVFRVNTSSTRPPRVSRMWTSGQRKGPAA